MQKRQAAIFMQICLILIKWAAISRFYGMKLQKLAVALL
jgi:hypothetical protein